MKAVGIHTTSTGSPKGVQEVSNTLVTGAVIVWFGQAFGVSRLMNRRGFHPLPWFMVLILLGPAVWPLALREAVTGPPRPELLQRGRPGRGALNVFVVFERDELPEQVSAQVARLMPYCHRLVLGRVIKAGGPTDIRRDAESFLRRIASDMRAKDPELAILYGDMRPAVQAIHEEGDFGVVLRSDQPDQVFAKLPVVPVPSGVAFQPVEADEVAARMDRLALGQPSGLVPEIAGPRVYGTADQSPSCDTKTANEGFEERSTPHVDLP